MTQPVRPLVAVDWGTSSLRAARLTPEGAVLDERASAQGILQVPAGGFPAVLDALAGDWLVDPTTLCLVSGMAGSKQGWQEAPYCACPAGFAEVAAGLSWVRPGQVAIVPGLSCEQDGAPDVLRGEEVQVFGALDLLGLEDGLFVLPGTHSKWVRVRSGRIASFTTWMSGEFYALLRRHSILSRTMPAEDGALDEPAFLQGLAFAQASASLLHAAFSARTLSLFDAMPVAAQPSYLSGLVIGEELRGQRLDAGAQVTIIANVTLAARYELALRRHGAQTRTLGAEATWRGLARIAQALENHAP